MSAKQVTTKTKIKEESVTSAYLYIFFTWNRSLAIQKISNVICFMSYDLWPWLWDCNHKIGTTSISSPSNWKIATIYSIAQVRNPYDPLLLILPFYLGSTDQKSCPFHPQRIIKLDHLPLYLCSPGYHYFSCIKCLSIQPLFLTWWYFSNTINLLSQYPSKMLHSSLPEE